MKWLQLICLLQPTYWVRGVCFPILQSLFRNIISGTSAPFRAQNRTVYGFWSCCFMSFKWISDPNWLTLNMHFLGSPRSCSTILASVTGIPGWGARQGGMELRSHPHPQSLFALVAHNRCSSIPEIRSSSPQWEALLFQSPFLVCSIL